MSTIKVNSIEPANAGSEDYFLARVWATFTTTTTTTLHADGNVSSLTDNGTGNTTVTFSSSLTSASYSCGINGAVNSTSLDSAHQMAPRGYKATGSLRTITGSSSARAQDKDVTDVQVFA